MKLEGFPTSLTHTYFYGSIRAALSNGKQFLKSRFKCLLCFRSLLICIKISLHWMKLFSFKLKIKTQVRGNNPNSLTSSGRYHKPSSQNKQTNKTHSNKSGLNYLLKGW